MNEQTLNYQIDLLGPSYEQTTLQLSDDDEGVVVATLVRKKAITSSEKAVLYVHGYIDYFFQKEMADHFNDKGYDFYALDLRKYGRSYRTYQTLFGVKDLKVYDEEINRSLKIIEDEGHSIILLSGHSTGGLILTYYALRNTTHPLIKGLWLNSPFYDFNVNLLIKKMGIPLVSKIAPFFSKIQLDNGLHPYYAKSLHKDYFGEWEFDLTCKPITYPFSSIQFIRAVHLAHRVIHKGGKLEIPTLIMHSDKSYKSKKWSDEIKKCDLVLDVKDINKYAKKLKGDITIAVIENGVHDLVLSQKNIRQKVYNTLFNWLKEKEI